MPQRALGAQSKKAQTTEFKKNCNCYTYISVDKVPAVGNVGEVPPGCPVHQHVAAVVALVAFAGNCMYTVFTKNCDVFWRISVFAISPSPGLIDCSENRKPIEVTEHCVENLRRSLAAICRRGMSLYSCHIS